MRIQKSPLTLFLLAICVPMQPQDAPSQPSVPYSSNFYEQGRAAFSARQWAQAAILLDRAEAEHPGKTDALVFRAEALLSLNRLHEADAALTAYTSAHPHSADALYLMGLVLQREKQPQRSLETLTTAASLRKPEANDLKIVAFDYVELKDYTDATHWFEVAVAMDPRNPELLYGLGRCYYAQSRFADAERAFNHVLEMDPRNIKAAENLGLALMYENRPEQAEKSFQRAIDLSRETRGRDEWPYLDYGSFLIDQNRSTDAIQVLKQGVALAPESSECHEKLGRALVQSGNAAAGIIEFEHAVSLKPSDAHLHYELGLAYRKAGMAEKAKTEFATSSALYGTKSEQERP